jgi:hypothetical protein
VLIGPSTLLGDLLGTAVGALGTVGHSGRRVPLHLVTKQRKRRVRVAGSDRDMEPSDVLDLRESHAALEASHVALLTSRGRGKNGAPPRVQPRVNAQRARAYGRAMRLLREAGAPQLSAAQTRTLREVADALIFATTADEASRAALASARAVLMAMRSTNPPCHQWLDQVADDLESCGPTTHWAQQWILVR